jgi:hypothetical protein
MPVIQSRRVMAIDMEKLSARMPRQRSFAHSISDDLRLVLLLWIHPCLLDILDYMGGGRFRRDGWQYKPLSMWGISDLLEASRCKTSSKLCLILGFCMCKITTLYCKHTWVKAQRNFTVSIPFSMYNFIPVLYCVRSEWLTLEHEVRKQVLF